MSHPLINLFLFLMLTSCKEAPVQPLHRLEVTLLPADTIAIPKISSSLFETSDLSLIDTKLGKYLAYFDDSDIQNKKGVYVFDLQTKNWNFEFIFDDIGPNSWNEANEVFSGMIMKDLQEAYLWNANSLSLSKLNHTSRQIKKYNFNEPSYDFIPIVSNQFHENFSISDELILPLNRIAFSNPESSIDKMASLITIQLNDSLKQIVIKDTLAYYPQVYKSGIFGLESYLYTPSIISLPNKEMFISYPIDPNIYRIDSVGNELLSFKIDSKHITKNIKPLIKSKERKDIASMHFSLDVLSNYTWTTPYYYSIFHIDGMDLFGRVVNRSSTLEDINRTYGSGQPINKFSIVFFDSNGDIKGEFSFPHKQYSIYSYFVINQTLYLYDMNLSSGQEDFIYYTGLDLSSID